MYFGGIEWARTQFEEWTRAGSSRKSDSQAVAGFETPVFESPSPIVDRRTEGSVSSQETQIPPVDPDRSAQPPSQNDETAAPSQNDETAGTVESSDSEEPVANESARVTLDLPSTDPPVLMPAPLATFPWEREAAEDRKVRVRVGEEEFILEPGEIAIELLNGHFFKGRIRKIDDTSITLYYDRGEMTFDFEELKGFTPNDAPEVQPLESLPIADVYLQNGSRFTGRVVVQTLERVVVKSSAGRLTFRASDVEDIQWHKRPSAGRAIPQIKSTGVWGESESPTSEPPVPLHRRVSVKEIGEAPPAKDETVDTPPQPKKKRTVRVVGKPWESKEN